MQATDRTEPGKQTLGDALRSLRRSRGLPQRDLLKPLHLGSHSAIVDFEAGRRIPPAAVVAAYEQFFGLASGTLRSAQPKNCRTPTFMPGPLPLRPDASRSERARLRRPTRAARLSQKVSPTIASLLAQSAFACSPSRA